MVVYKDAPVILRYSPLYTFVPLFLTGKVKNFLLIRYCTDKYICTFPVYPGICTVCIHDRRRQQVRKDLFLLSFCLV